MRLSTAIGIVTVMLTAACSDFPELDGAISNSARNGPWPTLLPMGQILAQTTNAPIGEQAARTLQSRVGGLHARAAHLRNRQIIEPDIRARMAAALARRG